MFLFAEELIVVLQRSHTSFSQEKLKKLKISTFKIDFIRKRLCVALHSVTACLNICGVLTINIDVIL